MVAVGKFLQTAEISQALDLSILPTSYQHSAMKTPILLLILTIGLFANSQAQVEVENRPEYPETVRIMSSCEPGYIWVDAEWIWNPATSQYDFVEARCIKSRKKHVYVPGYWKYQNEKWTWIEGEWLKIRNSRFARSRNP